MSDNGGRAYYRLANHAPNLAEQIAYQAGHEVPSITIPTPGTISYYFKSGDVNIDIIGCDAKGHAEIKIWTGLGEIERGVAFQEIRLLSQNSIQGLIKQLKASPKPLDDLEWTTMLQYCAWMSVEEARGTAPVEVLGTEPETMNLQWRLFPIIQENEPTTIFCPGGVGKSYLATYIACLIQFDAEGFTDNVDTAPEARDMARALWSPKQGNVLYLDWESNHRDHQRRAWAVKRGLGITEGTFYYLSCTQPLTKMLADIIELVLEHDIKLVIIDSQMAAADWGPDMAQNASLFYNALRELGCATLTLDHVSKASMAMPEDSNNSSGPHGSVVKYNRSRQQYELKKHQVRGTGTVDLVLCHRKNNEGPLAEDRGIRLSFINNPNTGHLDRVTFTPFDVSDHPVLSATLPLWQRLDTALEGGELSVKELAELLPDKTEATIRATLNQNKTRFVKRAGDQWGCLAPTQ